MDAAKLSQVPSVAAPPYPGTEPRHRAFKVGDIQGFALSDGGVPVPPPPGTPGSPDWVLRPLSCLLVRLPGVNGLVLLDAGFGPDAKRAGQKLPTAGRLMASLAAAGIAPQEVSTVLVSHIHPDHVDGLYHDDGTKTFRNAIYNVGGTERAFWGQEPLDLAWSSTPGPLKAEMVAAAQRLFGFAGDTLHVFPEGQLAIPGIEAVPLPGHTPGQVGFVLSSGGEKLLYTADAFTTVEMSIDAPERPNPFDLDPALGVVTRQALLRKSTQLGWQVFTPHFPWPNLGTVRNQGGRYAWCPTGQD